MLPLRSEWTEISWRPHRDPNRVSALKGHAPRPLDDGDGWSALGATFADWRTHYCDTATGTCARAPMLDTASASVLPCQ